MASARNQIRTLTRSATSLRLSALKVVMAIVIHAVAGLAAASPAIASTPIKRAIHLNTYLDLGFTVDSSPQGQRVRQILNRLLDLGFNHITLNVRAHMTTGTGNSIRSTVPPETQAEEERRLGELIDEAHRLGFTVGIRPVILVVGPRGEFPYTSGGIYWWHGVIEPSQPDLWFASLRNFHERYLRLAARHGIRSYTLAAEFHSMTTGLGERRPRSPRGYPEKWVEVVQFARGLLGHQTEIAYDFNYTDQYVLENGVRKLGGELEQVRWELTRSVTQPRDLAFQNSLREFWLSLDRVGIDHYRALTSRQRQYPQSHDALVQLLLPRTQSHATQLDNILLELEVQTGSAKLVELKEVGFRSSWASFLDPSSYENQGGTSNTLHQAAAWDAFLTAYHAPGWSWYAGTHVWEINVDYDHPKPHDVSFSPLGKWDVEAVFSRFFNWVSP